MAKISDDVKKVAQEAHELVDATETLVEDVVTVARNDTFELLKVMVGEARAKEMLGL